jgi:hypothetical protein
LLIPCFWQSRIQADDLSSHIYNAWLTLQVQHDAISGLHVTRQFTNIALDRLFVWLLPIAGVSLTQHIVVPIFVLIFCWGTFAFIRTGAGKPPWSMMICISLLAYGFVFHLGLLNFYFSTGVCFSFLGLSWNAGIKKTVQASPLLLVAWLGNPLPVLWTLGAIAYRKLAAHMAPRFLCAGCLLATLILRIVVAHIYPSAWSPNQISMVTGADQVFLYGKRYVVVMVALLLVWAMMLRAVALLNGWQNIAAEIAAQLWFLTAFAITVLPRSVLFNPHGAPVTFLPERMSLFCGVLVCALAAKANITPSGKTILVVATVLFFVFCYQDEHRLNRLESQVSVSVQQLFFPERVVFVPEDKSSRLALPMHIIDRTCIGHCLSYGNYEPASGHFRLRLNSDNPGVLSSYWDLQRLQQGEYIVQPRDLPIYQVVPISGMSAYKIIQLEARQRVAASQVSQ